MGEKVFQMPYYHRRLGKQNIWGHSTWLHERQLGTSYGVGYRDKLHKSVYTSLRAVSAWDPMATVDHSHHGAIYNLEFSPDGRILVAACERRSVLIFDPLTKQLINSIDSAHNDGVNCIKFLDSRMFATCSDDMTVALWDIRYLKHKIRSLRGHSSWVKNVEYASSVGVLVTSGFDGSIYTWDINSYAESGVHYKRIFHTDGLMRTKLTPDDSKLILCTTGGYIMVISNLDLGTVAHDLQSFNPNMYRLMQLSNTPIPMGYSFNHLFKAKRNRVELITDFPDGNDAEVISSLQVHPHGWCMLSRNTSNDENSEWTCVHDIQDVPNGKYNDVDCGNSDNEDNNDLPSDVGDSSSADPESSGGMRSARTDGAGGRSFHRPVVHIRFNCRPPPTAENPTNNAAEPGSRVTVGDRVGDIEIHISTSDVLEGLASMRRVVELNQGQVISSSVSTSTSAATTTSVASSNSASSNPASSAPLPRMSSSLSSSSENMHAPEEARSRRQAFEVNSDASRPGRDSWEDSDSSESGTMGESQGAPDVPTSNRSARGDPGGDERGYHGSRSDPGDERGVHLAFNHRPAYFIRTGNQLSARTVLLLGPNQRSQGTGAGQGNTRGLHSGAGGNSGGAGGGGGGGGSDPGQPRNDPRIIHNRPRLTHFMQELNVGRGFIKELCFSTDGRLICSPYGFGARLLAFDPECRELCDSVPAQPIPLTEVDITFPHSHVVMTTKFSPTHPLFVTGCLNGKVCFHLPNLS